MGSKRTMVQAPRPGGGPPPRPGGVSTRAPYQTLTIGGNGPVRRVLASRRPDRQEAFMKRLLVSLIGLLLAAALVVPEVAAAAPAAPSIGRLSATTMARSGRFKIGGSGFGSASETSHVLVGGVAAPFTRWSDTAIT